MNTNKCKRGSALNHLCALVAVFGCILFSSQSLAQNSRLDSAEFIELRNGLANSQHVFVHEGEARVAFLGGSITQMKGWRDLVCEDLQARFPNTQFDFVQAGIASMGSTPNAFRFSRDVLSHGRVDLLFVEAAVNDSTNHRTATEQIRGMEGIVRHARTANPHMDIVHLHFVDPDKMAAYRGGKRPEVIANHERVADYYGNPSIDLAREITERIDAGEFTWEDDFKNLHPSPFGHQIYLKSIQRLFHLAWADPTPTIRSKHAHPKTPLDIKSYTDGHILSIDEAEDLRGFKRVNAWKPADRAATRPGFTNVPMLVSERPGDAFAFTFSGTAVGLWVAAGPDAGEIEFSIDGAEYTRLDLYTEWSGMLHLPWAYILNADLTPDKHTLRVRVAKPSDEREHGGTAIRIAHFLVNG